MDETMSAYVQAVRDAILQYEDGLITAYEMVTRIDKAADQLDLVGLKREAEELAGSDDDSAAAEHLVEDDASYQDNFTSNKY